jgi:hypothetical protein
MNKPVDEWICASLALLDAAVSRKDTTCPKRGFQVSGLGLGKQRRRLNMACCLVSVAVLVGKQRFNSARWT